MYNFIETYSFGDFVTEIIMKKVFTIIIILTLAVSLTACNFLENLFYPDSPPLDFGSNESIEIVADKYEPLYDINNDRVYDAPTTDIELRVQSLMSDMLTAERVQGGTLYNGNLIRLARVLKRAEAAFIQPEEAPYFSSEDSVSSSLPDPSIDRSPITVSFFGSGGITGQGVEYMKDAYPFIIRRWFADEYGSDNFRFIFEGQRGTDSSYGAHAVSQKVLEEDTDILFIDYSLEDMKNENASETFESVIRTALSHETNCAVIILCTMDAACNSDYQRQLDIARAYGVPMISLRHAVASEISKGTFFFSSLTDDGFSIGLNGHKLFGDLCANFLENVKRQLNKIDTETDISIPRYPLTYARFVGGRHFTNWKRAKTFGSFVRLGLAYDIFGQSGWECTRPGGASMVYEIEAQHISVMYWRVIDRTGGRIEVLVDGSLVATLECDYIDGEADSAATALVYSGAAVATHTVEIRMSTEKNPGSTGERVCLLAIMRAGENLKPYS